MNFTPLNAAPFNAATTISVIELGASINAAGAVIGLAARRAYAAGTANGTASVASDLTRYAYGTGTIVCQALANADITRKRLARGSVEGSASIIGNATRYARHTGSITGVATLADAGMLINITEPSVRVISLNAGNRVIKLNPET